MKKLKKILLPILLLLTLSGGAWFWATIVEVQRGTASVQVDDARLRVWYNFVLPTYADTTAANANLGLDYIGAAIHTYTPAAIYFRDTSAAHHKWSILANTPASPIWGLITGTLSSQTDLQTALNAKQNLISLGTTAQYFRGDLSLATFPTDLSSFANGPGYLTAVNVSMSITGDGTSGTPLKLVGDNASPGANKYYGTDGGGTKGWNAFTAIGNIYTINGDITDDRYLGGPLSGGGDATKSLHLDSLNQLFVNESGSGQGATIYGKGGTSIFQIGGNAIGETIFSTGFSNIAINQSSGDSSEFQVYNASDTSKISLSPNYMTFYQFNGIYKIKNLVTSNDSSFKPIAINTTTKQLIQLDHWPGSGGSTNGVGRDTITTITSGTSSTVPNGTNIIRFNSTTVLTYTLTLPTTWHTSNDLLIAFTANGTIANGGNMVTLTIVNGSGQTLSNAVPISGTTFVAGEVVRYHLISTIDQRTN